MTTNEPTVEERAKFALDESLRLVGYVDSIETAIGNGYYTAGSVDTSEEFINNLLHSHVQGMQEVMQNDRERGYSPYAAWNKNVKESWPKWFKQMLAESEAIIFEGDPEFMTKREEEYLEFLTKEMEVPA